MTTVVYSNSARNQMSEKKQPRLGRVLIAPYDPRGFEAHPLPAFNKKFRSL